MFYFTIVRHGETSCNVAGIVQSRTHGELTKRGICMANLLGERLKEELFTHIFSSDLNRCRETTKIIVSNLKTKVPPISYSSVLQERDYGDWELQSTQIVGDKRMAMGLPFHLLHRVDIPNGESYEDCKRRAGDFFSEILKLADTAEDKNILVISHGHFISCLVEYLLDNRLLFDLHQLNDDDLKRKGLNTCLTRFSINKIKVTTTQHKFLLTFSHFFDSKHLKDVEL